VRLKLVELIEVVDIGSPDFVPTMEQSLSRSSNARH